jgi:mono/diheme cytochrome c family protein
MNKKIIVTLLISITLISCRGWRSEKPPIHPNINFDFQPKIKAQRQPLEVPENTHIYELSDNKEAISKYKIDERFIKNGQKNYNIYCAACHTKTGDGTKSIISKNGWIVSNILEDVTVNKSDDDLYNIITNGIRTMPGYGKKLSSQETWEVVLYVRALQKIAHVTPKEIKMITQKEGQ